jgi:hypothetical protein
MKRTPVVHPFLFSLFPILALYAYNLKSIPISAGELAGPLAASIACVAVLYLVLRTALKNPAKAGLLVSLLVAWFFSFGHIAGQVAVWTEGIFNRSLFFATAVLVGLAAFLVIRSRRTFAGLTRILNVASATLVLLNVVSVAQTLIRRPHAVLGKEVRVSRQATSRPNIYYIVLDAYTRADVLQEVFGHDNSAFLSALESKGFTVAARSYANYNLTHQSLASSLNFSYLDELARDVGGVSSDREPLYAMIRKNRVMAFLKSQGYRLITLSSSIEPTDIKTVDLYVGFKGLESEFRTVLLNTTPLPLFFRLGKDGSPYDAHRKRILNAFRALAESPLDKGPFFLFVHLMSPHPPFVFGRGGEPVDPDYLFSMVDADRLHGASEAAIRRYIPAYRDQLTFLNKKILEVVEAILSRSPEPPIIIIQGDHGSRAYADLDRPEGSYFKENLAILNAYLLPGLDRSLVYPRISPVNTFRLIFTHYFGADLDLLEDASSWSTWRRPYRFIPFDEASYAATMDSVRKSMKPKSPVVQKR